MSEACLFCDEEYALDRHHIVPQRYGGSDEEENLVTVCPTCHRKLETLYDTRFYESLGIEKDDGKNIGYERNQTPLGELMDDD